MPIANSGIHMIKANNLCSHITILKKLKVGQVCKKARKWKQFMLFSLKKKSDINNQTRLV